MQKSSHIKPLKLIQSLSGFNLEGDKNNTKGYIEGKTEWSRKFQEMIGAGKMALLNIKI